MTDVIIRQNGNVGHITLNRPDALNALTYDMILKIETALISWKQNEEVKIVLVDANGDKAFCSGGDVSDLYKNGTTGNFEFGKLFWSDEYRLNLLVSNYPKESKMIGKAREVNNYKSIWCAERIQSEKLKFELNHGRKPKTALMQFSQILLISTFLKNIGMKLSYN